MQPPCLTFQGSPDQFLVYEIGEISHTSLSSRHFPNWRNNWSDTSKFINLPDERLDSYFYYMAGIEGFKRNGIGLAMIFRNSVTTNLNILPGDRLQRAYPAAILPNDQSLF